MAGIEASVEHAARVLAGEGRDWRLYLDAAHAALDLRAAFQQVYEATRRIEETTATRPLFMFVEGMREALVEVFGLAWTICVD